MELCTYFTGRLDLKDLATISRSTILIVVVPFVNESSDSYRHIACINLLTTRMILASTHTHTHIVNHSMNVYMNHPYAFSV